MNARAEPRDEGGSVRAGHGDTIHDDRCSHHRVVLHIDSLNKKAAHGGRQHSEEHTRPVPERCKNVLRRDTTRTNRDQMVSRLYGNHHRRRERGRPPIQQNRIGSTVIHHHRNLAAPLIRAEDCAKEFRLAQFHLGQREERQACPTQRDNVTSRRKITQHAGLHRICLPVGAIIRHTRIGRCRIRHKRSRRRRRNAVPHHGGLHIRYDRQVRDPALLNSHGEETPPTAALQFEMAVRYRVGVPQIQPAPTRVRRHLTHIVNARI